MERDERPPAAVESTKSPAWQRIVLRLAGIYNLAWGTWVVLFPLSSLRACGYAEPPTYPEHWQCIGMIVGVYGIGYWIAGNDPVRHWPIVLVGWLGKVLGPIGFLWSWWRGRLPLSAGWVNIFNDLIWWIPFTLILLHAYRRQQTGTAASPTTSFDEAIRTVRSQTGQTIAELSESRPLLLVFLRHAGCTFCRETLAAIRSQREQIERTGTGLAFVHMADNADDSLFHRFGLEALPRFSDPDQRLYQAFELRNAQLSELLTWRTFLRGFWSAIVRGRGFGPIRQNVYRLPGSFIVHGGRILAAHRAQSPSDRADALGLCEIGLAGGDGAG